METQPAIVQDVVREIISSGKNTYIDSEKLLDSLIAGEDPTQEGGISKLIDVERLISDINDNKRNVRDGIM